MYQLTKLELYKRQHCGRSTGTCTTFGHQILLSCLAPLSIALSVLPPCLQAELYALLRRPLFLLAPSLTPGQPLVLGVAAALGIFLAQVPVAFKLLKLALPGPSVRARAAFLQMNWIALRALFSSGSCTCLVACLMVSARRRLLYASALLLYASSAPCATFSSKEQAGPSLAVAARIFIGLPRARIQ